MGQYFDFSKQPKNWVFEGIEGKYRVYTSHLRLAARRRTVLADARWGSWVLGLGSWVLGLGVLGM